MATPRYQYGYRPYNKGRQINNDASKDDGKGRRVPAGKVIAVPTQYALPAGFQRVPRKSVDRAYGSHYAGTRSAEYEYYTDSPAYDPPPSHYRNLDNRQSAPAAQSSSNAAPANAAPASKGKGALAAVWGWAAKQASAAAAPRPAPKPKAKGPAPKPKVKSAAAASGRRRRTRRYKGKERTFGRTKAKIVKC